MSVQIAVVGQGYVGLTVAMGAASANFEVIGIDINATLVEELNNGNSHIEGIPDFTLKTAIESRLYRASTNFADLEKSEVVVIAVPTPLDNEGRPDLTILKNAVLYISKHIKEGALVINESTSYIGTLRELIAAPIMAMNHGVLDFAVSPERVDPGNEKFQLGNTPRIVGGITPSATERAANFYSTFCENVVKVDSPEIAEAAKLLENTFRFINIGFINEFTQILNKMGIPVTKVIAAAATKPYGFMKFFPSAGIGGHCIPVDPLYFQKAAEEIGLKSKYIDLSENINHEMPNYLVNRLESLYGNLSGRHVLVIGVTYKPDVADIRESPAERVIEILRSKGAKVLWHDPLIKDFYGEVSSPLDGDYDVVLVLAKHIETNMELLRSSPIYCVNSIESEPNWIPLFSPKSSH